MPLPGEASAKYGFRFEAKWTVRCIARLLSGDADSMRLVPPGEEGEGIEFWLKRGTITECHQVKRQRAGSDAWSVSELDRAGVLTVAFRRVEAPNTRFVFVSTISSGGLDDLANSAQKATTYDEFMAEFVTGSRVKTWKALTAAWAPEMPRSEVLLRPSDGDAAGTDSDLSHLADEIRKNECNVIAFERLKRMEFLNEHERILVEDLDGLLRSLVLGNPARIRNDLFSFVSERVHGVIYPDTVWTYLGELGHVPSDYGRSTSVLLAVQKLNSRYGSLVGAIGPGIVIPRDEAASAFETLLGSGGAKRSVLISGEAGTGKTGVLGQVIQKVKDATIPHIYLRVDALTPVETPQLLSAQLDLPASPVDVLAGIAKGRPCVLVVDQLDAVSMVSGRNPDFFICIHELIREARAHSNMRLLMACRKFDLRKDNRLREMISDRGPAHEIETQELSLESVKTVLDRLGCRPSDYSDRQLALLRLPLHLALFAEAIGRRDSEPLLFATEIDLFKAYWEDKRRTVRARLGAQPDQWTEVVDRICDRISERQALFTPEQEVLDDYEPTVRAMESEGVLVLDGDRVGFFHEGFFDYAFARRFPTRGRELIHYLEDGEQGLFKRAPLRQILLHTHATDHADFVRELRRVTLAPSIRFHLRRCALEVAAKVECATPELWQLFQAVFASGDPALIREVWRVLWVATPWFPFLHGKGLIASWLASDDPDQRQRALAMVRNRIKTHPGECVDLLSPYVGASDKWNADILHIIWHRVLSTDRRVFDLFMRMHAAGAIANEGHQDFWMCMHDLPKNRPDWAAEALGQHLRLTLASTRVEDIEWHFLPRDSSGERLVLEIAGRAPSAFLDQVLPVFLEVVQRTALDRDGKLTIDHVWHARAYREECLSIEAALLQGIEDAFKALAMSSIPEYARYVDQLRPHGDYDSVNFVIVRGLATAPPAFAEGTVEYLLANPQRLECGWPCGGGGDFSYWAARELVEHVAPHCSDDAFERLEAVMTDYFPRWETSKDGYRQRGYWQLVMLPALPADRRGPRTEARLGEWQRKFPGREIEPPIASKVRCVGSPIKAEAIPRMKDADWLRALQAYDTDEASRRRPHGFLEGGSHQLSGVLEAETKRDPVRFAKLSEQFPTNTHRYYYHALLRGLKESNADKDTVLGVVRRVFALPEKPGHRYLCDAIAKFSAEDLPEDILAIVGWCATEAEDPQGENLTVRSSGSEEDNRPHDILTTAINSVRGAAAETVGTLLFDRANRVPFFMPYLERMVHDPTVIVRTTVANSLLCLYKHDEARAVDLFLILVDTDNDHLLATHHVDRFLHYANVRHFQRLRPVLRRMIDSAVPAVRQTGARHVCLAQFSNPEADDMVAECVAGDEAQRKGASTVAEANLFNPECAAFTHDKLPVFFNDPVKEIRDEAAGCFRNAEGRDLEKAKPIIRAFLESNAFGENVEDLMWPLEHSTADIAEEILLTCEAVISHMEAVGQDTTHSLYGHADTVAELVLRAYRQTNDATVRTRCLDIVDRLLAQEVYGMSKELEEFER